MATPRQTAEAFSGHRFEEAYDQLADDVRWVVVGQMLLRGRDEVVRACTGTATHLATTTTEFLRFVVVEDRGATADQRVVVDAVARYRDADGTTSLVSSCDIYEFADGRLVGITSYGVELDPDSTEEQWYTGAGG
jgi:ketosteroid isomerase-like protein